jgi:FG-GAP-like repeat
MRLRTSLVAPLVLVAALSANVLSARAAQSPAPTWTATTPVGSVSSSSPAPQPFAGVSVGDLFGDGRQDVVAGFPDGSVRAWFPDGTPIPGWPRSVGGVIHENPTLVDLNHDGRLEVVVTSENGYVNVFNPDGSNYGGGWPQHSLYGGTFHPGFFSTVAAGDLYGNGQVDLVAGSWDHRLYAWNAQGSLLPGFPINLFDTIWDTPTLVSLEHNGQLDIVVGSDSSGGHTEPYPAGGVYWAFRPNGTAVPGWPKTTNQVPWASTAAGDIDGSGWDEVVAGSGHYYSAPAGQQVWAWSHGGSVVPGWPQATGGRNFASPAVGDLLGNGGREVVQMSENGLLYAWNGNGSLLSGWPVNPGGSAQLSAPVIAPVDGSGHNGVWVLSYNSLLGYSGSGALVDNITLPGPGVAAPTVANLGNGHLSVVALSQTSATNNRWAVSVYPIAGSTTMPTGAWPTFHGSNLHAGTEPPSAHMLGLPSSEGSTQFTISWAPDAGSVAPAGYAVWLTDNGGAWMQWETTSATSTPFFGIAGHTYQFDAVALASGNQVADARPLVAQVSTTVSSGAGLTTPFNGLYGVDGSGNLRPGSSPPLAATGHWPGWSIVRGIAVAPGGRGGYVVDGYGGVWPFGNAPGVSVTGYWSGWDIVRGIAVRPDGHSGYVLDAYGGVWPFGGAPGVSVTGYWRGWDIARGIVLRPDGVSGYVLDGYGGVWPFGGAPGVAMSGYWSGWDIARGLTLRPDGHSGYVLDGYGGVWPFGGAPGVQATGYWGGSDVARGITLVPGSSTQGYVIDTMGGMWPFGGAPGVFMPNYGVTATVRGISAG